MGPSGQPRRNGKSTRPRSAMRPMPPMMPSEPALAIGGTSRIGVARAKVREWTEVVVVRR